MSVHLLTGDDESLLRAAVSDLVHDLVGDGDRSLMVDEFDGDDVELRAIVDSAQTPPFLTERRVVVARDVGRFSADDLAPLLTYLGDAAGEHRPGARRWWRPPGQGPHRCGQAGGWVVTFDGRPDEGAGPSGLGRHPRRGGRCPACAAPAAAMVAERLGEDVGRLDGLLATLAATFGASRQLRARRRRAVHR